ncbi:hypothetical protein [Aurantiacibacter poecillastricola]|uniref:hypothetical protein n=1 Tax=Aurantiacibacter poecillastricola TaxID=3064385 RepID=UPI00273F1A30|nr:hypothetical protein [Aurantiacibacter sp. 219JJ12-13]MDP5263510.1 hypothetical protein [Aurantiacibacter sp. 219JJ12-13]
MKISIESLAEPSLVFRNGKRGIEPRRVLSSGSKSDNLNVINIGLVGPPDDVAAVRKWLGKLDKFQVAREANAKRYRDWPGARVALASEFEIPSRFVRSLDQDAVEDALTRVQRGTGFEDLLEMFASQITGLFRDGGPDCVVICLPEVIGDLRVDNPALSAIERRALERLQAEEESAQMSLFQPTPEELQAAKDLRVQADDLLFRTFYRALKVRCMQHQNAVPIQVIRRDTVERADDKGHSHATRAWNLAVSLYYKAGSMPWQPADLPSNTCFVGVSFHHLKRRSGSLIYASLAQAVASDVEPFALSGAMIDHDQRRDKQPYLNKEQASNLISEVIKEYLRVAGVTPDRIILHKTSNYQPEEVEGFLEGSKDAVPSCDLIWMRPTPLRVIRRGMEEPWRGTLVSVGDESYLFTNGFIPWWNEYPGPHIPAPIEIGSAKHTDLKERAREILALSKINWNSTEGMSRYPVTLSFAKKVGQLMAEFPEGQTPNPSYRFYM